MTLALLYQDISLDSIFDDIGLSYQDTSLSSAINDVSIVISSILDRAIISHYVVLMQGFHKTVGGVEYLYQNQSSSIRGFLP